MHPQKYYHLPFVVYGVEIRINGEYECMPLFESRTDAEGYAIDHAERLKEEMHIDKHSIRISESDDGLEYIYDEDRNFEIIIQDKTVIPKKERRFN